MLKKPFLSPNEEPLKTEPMSNVDTAWYRMEEVTNQMTITAVLTFGAPLGIEDMRRILRERFLVFDRFRQRVQLDRRPFSNPRWEEDPSFDLDNHLKLVQLPAPGSKAQLQDLASDLMSRPLDFSRPLWMFHVVEGYEGGGALIVRLHHCIADGVTLVRVLLSLTDATADASLQDTSHRNGTENGTESDDAANDAAEAPPAVDEPPQGGEEEPSSQSFSLRRLASVLKQVGRKSARLAALIVRCLRVLGKLVWPVPDPDTAFRGTLGRAKRATWSDPVSLEDVKAIGRELGGTVNDVLLTVVTGALRRYLERRSEPTKGLDMRAAVPVNLRPPEAPLAMGNAFGLVFLALPVGTRNPVERLQILRRRMDRLKGSPEAPLLRKILGLVGAGMRTLQNGIVSYLARKVTAVATNVPGPQETRYLAGAPLETLMAWVPQAARVGLGISVISYDGQVRLGLATDAHIVPDPEVVIEDFCREFEALRRRVPEREPARAFTSSGPSAGRPPRLPPVPDREAGGDGEVVQTSAQNDAAPEEAGASAQREEASAPKTGPDRCQATTKAGSQCKLPAQDGSHFCHVHR